MIHDSGGRLTLRPPIEHVANPMGGAETAAFEADLTAMFGTRYAVAVSSGTAALHTALVACHIGPGDEVLVPAVTVPMTVAAVAVVGARPVFYDCTPDGHGPDLADLAAKISSRSQAVLPVHLAGRTEGILELVDVASANNLWLIEDACQAQGSRNRQQQAGTVGHVGCFSLKDGKIISCGEGGYLLTNDDELAARARAYRSHWQTPAPDAPAGSRLGHNFRLAEPLAALARNQLSRFDLALAQRRRQERLLWDVVGDVPGLEPIPPHPDEEPNGYSALWRITLDQPRVFSERVARLGVANSIGTHGLTAAPRHPAYARFAPHPCPNAVRTVDHLLAVSLHTGIRDAALHTIASTIRQEAAEWKR